jgi:hypothetical protein
MEEEVEEVEESSTGEMGWSAASDSRAQLIN